MRVFAVVKPEAHFVQIGRQVFRADFMPRSNDAALQERERRLDSIGVNLAMRVFAGVVNRLVLRGLYLIQSEGINQGFIGQNNFDVSAHVRVDDVLHSLGLRVLRANHPKISVALANPDNDLRGVLRTPAALLARNIGFVYLYHTAKQRTRLSLYHRLANAVREVPRCFVADADGALNLAGGHSLFRFAEQRDGNKPLPQRQVRIVKHRARGYAKLVMA